MSYVDFSRSSLSGADTFGWGRLNIVWNRPDVVRRVYEWTRNNVSSVERRIMSASGEAKRGWYD